MCSKCLVGHFRQADLLAIVYGYLHACTASLASEAHRSAWTERILHVIPLESPLESLLGRSEVRVMRSVGRCLLDDFFRIIVFNSPIRLRGSIGAGETPAFRLMSSAWTWDATESACSRTARSNRMDHRIETANGPLEMFVLQLSFHLQCGRTFPEERLQIGLIEMTSSRKMDF